MPKYRCHILVSLAYNLAWSANQAEMDRLIESLHQIGSKPATIDEPTEAELRALNLDLPAGACLKVGYLIEADTPYEAATSLRAILNQIEMQNQPAWWFLNALPIETN